MTGASLSAEDEKKSNADLEAELDKLQTEYDSIENQIRAASPRYASLTQPAPLTLADVQSQVLDDKTVLLEYSLGAPNSYLWAVTQSGVSDNFHMRVPIYLDFGKGWYYLGSANLHGSTSVDFTRALPQAPKRASICAFNDVLAVNIENNKK